MLQGIALLVATQLLGEALAVVTGLPVPGPVLGMGLLLAALVARRGRMPEVRRAAGALLGLVPLLLVPISVGVMDQVQALRADAWPLAAALLLSTAAGMAATALVVRWLRPLDPQRPPASAPDASQPGPTQAGVDPSVVSRPGGGP